MSSKQSCLVIAGEKSGEDHAMTFFPKLKEMVPHCDFYGVGGSRLEGLGVELKYNLREFSGMGFTEVLGKIPFYYRALDAIIEEVKKRNTKTAILIDFQGFNLKLAVKLKKLGVNVLYYVAPQAWVWKPWRAKVLEKNVHTLFTILPFEKEWFQKRGVSKVKAVIHPLMIEYNEELEHLRERSFTDFENRKLRILLLPGSRNSEVGSLLATFEKGINLIKEDLDIEVGIVKTESVDPELYINSIDYTHEWGSLELAKALNWADMSIAASGTVTLATGLFQVPTIVCYKVSFVTEMIVSLIIPYTGAISLTNIIHGSPLFPELLQYQVDRYNMAKYIKKWARDESIFTKKIEDLKSLKSKLTGDDFDVPSYMAEVILSET